MQVEPTHRPPVVASHASFRPPRQPPQSVPAPCRLCKRHLVAVSPRRHRRCLATGSLHKKRPVSPKGVRGFLLPAACARAALPAQSRRVPTRTLRCREFPMASAAPPRPRQHWRLASPAGPDLLPGSPCCGALLLSPLGCPHTASPRPLPETDLRSLSLSTQPLPEHLRLWCPGRWCRRSVRLSLCFAGLSPAAALFSATFRSLRLR